MKRVTQKIQKMEINHQIKQLIKNQTLMIINTVFHQSVTMAAELWAH